MPGNLEIRLLGGLQLIQDGEPLTAFISNKVPALFAYLAVTQRAHQRDALAALLWGEMADADAKNNLRQALSNLRKFLDSYLLVTRDTLQFNPSAPHTLDMDDFVQGTHLPQLTIENSQFSMVNSALALYHGDFLQGFFVREAPEFEDWAYSERVRLRELAFQALQKLTAYHQKRGAYPQALQTANRLLTFDPWREETHRQLMLLYARSGQRSAALAQYEQCRRVLAKELDVEPSAETNALYERIRAAGDTFPNNLTLRPTAFVGRTEELEHLDSLFTRPDSRLITLLGPGGIGKTRLALQAARHALQRGLFLSGVFFVSLEGVDNPDLIPTAIAEAVGLAFAGNQEPKNQVLAYLKSREILLILDNIEQLLDGVPWLVQILQNAPRAQLLVTSRERLNTQWEWTVPVEGLDYPPSDTPLAQAADTGAVQLFTARAQAARPDFALTHETLPTILRVCQLLSGTPLALELAAANMRYYTCAEIEAEIAQNFDFLTANFRDLPTRQRSLRAVFDYSWRLLAPPEQRTFAALSVFRGGFTAEGARQVAGATAPLLAGLGDKSLIRRDEQGRFHLHEMLRQYAAEKLAERAEEIHQQHGAYFAAFVQQRGAAISSPQQTHMLNELAHEMDNVRAAWHWTITHQPGTTLLPFINGLFDFYEIRAWIQEGADQFGTALKALRRASVPGTELVHMKLLNRQARFLHRLGQRVEAEENLGNSLALAGAVNDLAELALTYNYLGLNKQTASNYPEALQLYEKSLSLYAQINDPIGKGRALNNLGVILYRMGELDEAQKNVEASLAIRRGLGDPKGTADGLNNLGILLHEKNAFAEEARLLEEALTIYRTIEDIKGISTCLHNLGGVYLAMGQFSEAKAYFQQSLNLREKSGDPIGVCFSLNNLGTTALRMGNAREAASYYLEALRIAWQGAEIPTVLDLLVGAGECLSLNGQSLLALEILAFGLTQEQDSDTRAETERQIAEIRLTLPADDAAQAIVRGQALLLAQVVKIAERQLTELSSTSDAKAPEEVISPVLPVLFPASLAPTLLPVSAPPAVSGGYILENLLARGGMGEVFRGRDTQTGQIVAIKRLLPHLLTQNPDALTRFQREADLLRQLNHPNIVKIISTLVENGEYLLVMEYVPGGTLRDLLDHTPVPPLNQTIRLALELADALARAHHLGIIHRDLKPVNILLAADGSPRLADFGIARLIGQNTRLTEEGAAVGTIAYMSPEACMGEDLDTRADVWSFGVLLYEMLTGKNPFECAHYTATLTAILHQPALTLADTHPELPPTLTGLVQRLLVKDRERRPNRMRQIAATLEQILVR
ncbi:MAG: protein kinase [Anaerolineales bacterium]|nr:protein kinase [Anaerolineales bacterium]